jgi:hypothetical protein
MLKAVGSGGAGGSRSSVSGGSGAAASGGNSGALEDERIGGGRSNYLLNGVTGSFTPGSLNAIVSDSEARSWAWRWRWGW